MIIQDQCAFDTTALHPIKTSQKTVINCIRILSATDGDTVTAPVDDRNVRQKECAVNDSESILLAEPCSFLTALALFSKNTHRILFRGRRSVAIAATATIDQTGAIFLFHASNARKKQKIAGICKEEKGNAHQLDAK